MPRRASVCREECRSPGVSGVFGSVGRSRGTGPRATVKRGLFRATVKCSLVRRASPVPRRTAVCREVPNIETGRSLLPGDRFSHDGRRGPSSVGRGPVPRRASVYQGASRGTGPRATVKGAFLVAWKIARDRPSRYGERGRFEGSGLREGQALVLR